MRPLTAWLFLLTLFLTGMLIGASIKSAAGGSEEVRNAEISTAAAKATKTTPALFQYGGVQ